MEHGEEAVQEWLDDSDYDTISIVVRHPAVTVTVAGSGELPPVEELAQELSRNIGSDQKILRGGNHRGRASQW